MKSPFVIKNASGQYFAHCEFVDGCSNDIQAVRFGLTLDPLEVVEYFETAKAQDASAFIVNLDSDNAVCLEVGTTYFDYRSSQRATIVYSTSTCIWAKLERRDELEFMSINSFRYNERAGRYVILPSLSVA